MGELPARIAPMTASRPIILALFVAAALAAGGLASPDRPEQDPASPPRVILRVNRNLQIRGTVDLEDENVIVVRDLDGKIESFAKHRVVQIVRLVEPSPGQRGTVVLRNGQTRQGVIIEDSWDRVVIEVEGIRAVLPRDGVDYVMLEPTFEEQYTRYKAALEPGMYDEHYRLCTWLFDHRAYALAERELAELLSNVDMVDAHKLLSLTRSQLALAHRPDSAPDREEPANNADPGDPSSGPVYERDLLPKEILGRADVNLIRVYEIDLRNPPRVKVDADTIRKLVEHYGASSLIPDSQDGRTAMFRADPIRIVELMFRLKARELYPEVRVLTEPKALNLFRQRVHDTWLMNNCATSRCHGGLRAGRLFLHRLRHKDERVRFTNLLILHRLDLDSRWPLVNYEEPIMSRIIQFGLPRGEARLPHPDVPGWRPAFRPGADRMKQDALAWIEAMMLAWIEAMMHPRPRYPVDYEPPVIEDAGAPSDEAAPDGRAPR
jgi:hypothetical protein